ncbi:PAS domain S-box protein [Sulfurimonas sp. HSL3-7]|uniref:PAS domain S-box protein n=1 Tax=Sulfonitrofixus jiaomeiensis TaxID=3131938 RepID=UPI0031F8ED9F
MKIRLFLSLLFAHSFLQADSFGTLFMSATLYLLLFTLIIALTAYLKDLQEEKLRYRTFFQHTKTAALFIDAKGIIRDLNKSAQALTGYTKEQLTGQKWYEKLLADEAALAISHRLCHADTREVIHTFNAPLISADGANILEASFTLTPFPKPLKGSILTLVALH